jgi:hypothetical protein
VGGLSDRVPLLCRGALADAGGMKGCPARKKRMRSVESFRNASRVAMESSGRRPANWIIPNRDA